MKPYREKFYKEFPMDEERDVRPAEDYTPFFYWGDLDQETIDILVDDKIATGG